MLLTEKEERKHRLRDRVYLHLPYNIIMSTKESHVGRNINENLHSYDVIVGVSIAHSLMYDIS